MVREQLTVVKYKVGLFRKSMDKKFGIQIGQTEGNGFKNDSYFTRNFPVW